MSVRTILGNEAIALGLVEQGCRVVTAYPGTPSSEILAGVVKFKKEYDRQIYTEWSINEKVAFEIALAASWTGLRAAVAMKMVGLNVAADPLFSSAYTGVKGGFVIIPADDPGPHSSQTEQDSRLLALTAKIPVFDPSSPKEARSMVEHALFTSEKYGIPVILRPTTRLCHAVQSVEISDSISEDEIPSTRFQKDPPRWTATPKFRNLLHAELNQKLLEIEEEFNHSELNYISNDDAPSNVGIISSGVAFHTVQQSLAELKLDAPILKISTPFPLPIDLVTNFIARFKSVIVIEEPDACIEIQIPSREKIRGRHDMTVPNAGELRPEIVTEILIDVFRGEGIEVVDSPIDTELRELISSLELPVRRPRLCPGCSHRSAFHSIKREFGARGIYPGDIGCYTLGMNLRAVDTFVDMGASITMANGFYQANQIIGDKRPIVATIGDSTFLHSGIPALINAVHTGAKFVLVILDNRTTAMTGFQPTPANEILADGSLAAKNVSIVDLVRACGVGFVLEIDPYENDAMRTQLQKAHEFTQSPEGSVAVIIANRPCILYDPQSIKENPFPVVITAECDGCRYCLEVFECPAMSLSADTSRVDIDYKICVDCGQCIDSCYKGFILPEFPIEEEALAAV